METKFLEIRDRGTFIAALAVRFSGADDRLAWRAGYGRDQQYVILAKLDGVEAHYDSFDWPNQRTMGNAHRHIEASWETIANGAVVDVEFVLGETTAPKESELQR